VPVTSAREMRAAVLAAAPAATVIVKAAAVADYRPAEAAAQKIKKGEGALNLRLERNPDILAELGGTKGERILVGFAAETGDLVANARKKLEQKNLDLIVANDVTQAGAGFDVDTNIVRILGRDGSVEELPLLSKDEVAHRLLDCIASLRRKG
jgi:phosphopantothenoylcysteine decarboxylase/phosphopantothenate--cysteine ligase